MSYYFLKGKVSEGSKSSGIFVCKIDNNANIMEFSFVLRPGVTYKNFNIRSDINKFKESIDSERSKVQEHDRFFSIISSVDDHFSKSISHEKIEKIVKLISTSNDDYLKNVLIKDIITQELCGASKLDLAVELTVEVIEDRHSDEQEEDTENGAEETISSSYFVHLKCKPIVSPAKGIKANKIKVGDEIFIKIIDEKEDVSKLLTNIAERARNENKLIAELVIKAPVVEIERDITNDVGDTNSLITVQFNTGVFGKIDCQSELKIKAVEHSNIVNTTETEQQQVETAENLGMLFILCGIILFFIFVITFIIVYA